MTTKNIKIRNENQTKEIAQSKETIIGIPYYLYIDRNGVYKASAEEVQKTISVIEIANQINANNEKIVKGLEEIKNNSDVDEKTIENIKETVRRNKVYGDILKTYCYQIID